MTPPNLTGSALAAWHRREAARIEAEERARRPALAAGQVWKHQTHGYACLFRDLETNGLWLAFLEKSDGLPMHADGVADGWEIVPGASLRVVPPDPPAPQVAPEPTGAELVGRACWCADYGPEIHWCGPFKVARISQEDQFYEIDNVPPGMSRWPIAKPYVEGVAP